MDWFGRSHSGSARARRAAVTTSTGSGGDVPALDTAPSADAPYLLPTDEREIHRLDFQHYMLRHALKGNYSAPLRDPASILDVGCGTGRWAAEMAAHFPQARVVGMDLASVQSGALDATRPLNYSFAPGNVFDGLPFASGLFDYTHMRLLFLAIPAERWPTVVRELIRVTREDGWIELVEGGVPHGGGPALAEISRLTMEASRRHGIDLTFGARIGDFLRAAGVREVTMHEIQIPIGGNGGRIGAMMATNFLAGIEGLQPLLVTHGLASPQEFAQITAAIRFEMTRWQLATPFYIAYGRR